MATCIAKKGDGSPCSHLAKSEYDNRYCGIHKSQYEMELKQQEARTMQGFHCGIDIGDINLAITFLDRNSGKIVSYIGSVDDMMRLEEHVDPTMVRLECPKATLKHDRVFLLLDSITEFNTTINVIIERQPSLASAEGCRTDGLIMGYLRGKGLSCCYLDSRVRQSFTESVCDGLSTTAKKKDKEVCKTDAVPASRKAFSISFVIQKYPSFLDYARSKRKKIDDICDSLIYAYMSSEALTSAKNVKKAL